MIIFLPLVNAVMLYIAEIFFVFHLSAKKLFLIHSSVKKLLLFLVCGYFCIYNIIWCKVHIKGVYCTCRVISNVFFFHYNSARQRSSQGWVKGGQEPPQDKTIKQMIQNPIKNLKIMGHPRDPLTPLL